MLCLCKYIVCDKVDVSHGGLLFDDETCSCWPLATIGERSALSSTKSRRVNDRIWSSLPFPDEYLMKM